MHGNQQFCNSRSHTTSRAAAAALAIAMVVTLAAIPALTQNAVPPTARQAASDPAFASRLAHQAQESKSRALAPSRRALPQYGTLYDNGPYNGTTDAWTINFGFSVSDSFTGTGFVNGLHFVYWDASTTDFLTTVDISIGSTSFGGSPQTLTGVTNTLLGFNQYGYALYQADYQFSPIASGPGYVTLSNACTTSGCSVSNPIYWDENSGVGCTSQGCPSTAYENTLGSIPSETFSLDGGSLECVHDVPQDGFKIIHDFTVQGQGPNGVVIDQAGNLYGTTVWGGDRASGRAYELSPEGQDWIFNSLYSFLGGADGQNPSPAIIGPEGALYGTAGGGIRNCGSSGSDYCGLVYRLRPSPVACLTGLCSWTAEVLYRFTGDPNGWQPSGHPVFDRTGNLYGITLKGGAYGHGAVFELTPSNIGWTEKVIYSFTGSDGDGPNSLLVGQDGNLYGTTYVGGYGGGVVFQLVPSGGVWIEQVIASFGPCSYWTGCSPFLVQESSGKLYGIDSYDLYLNDGFWYYWDNFGIIFMMSPSEGGWQVTVIDDTLDYYNPYLGLQDIGIDLFYGLTIDAAGNLYATEGGWEAGGPPPDGIDYWGKVFELFAPHQEQTLVSFKGNSFRNLTIGASGNLYGTTGLCGDPGSQRDETVWELTPKQ